MLVAHVFLTTVNTDSRSKSDSQRTVRIVLRCNGIANVGKAGLVPHAGLSWIHDLDGKECILVRALRGISDGPIPVSVTLRSVLICVLYLVAVLPNTSAKAIPAVSPKRQQIEVLFLSSSDPDLPDVAALIEHAETQILNGSD